MSGTILNMPLYIIFLENLYLALSLVYNMIKSNLQNRAWPCLRLSEIESKIKFVLFRCKVSMGESVQVLEELKRDLIMNLKKSLEILLIVL